MALQIEVDDKRLKQFSEIAKKRLLVCTNDYSKGIIKKANRIAKMNTAGGDIEVTGEMVMLAASHCGAFRRRKWLTSANFVKVLNGASGLFAGGLFDPNGFSDSQLRFFLFLVCVVVFLGTLILQCVMDD